MWNSARILHPRLFEKTPDEPFSFLTLMDYAQNTGRLAAHIHEGAWHHLTTPDDVKAVNKGWKP
jgi:MurNAc alpha-1-phosphate uridylyltransferase